MSDDPEILSDARVAELEALVALVEKQAPVTRATDLPLEVEWLLQDFLEALPEHKAYHAGRVAEELGPERTAALLRELLQPGTASILKRLNAAQRAALEAELLEYVCEWNAGGKGTAATLDKWVARLYLTGYWAGLFKLKRNDAHELAAIQFSKAPSTVEKEAKKHGEAYRAGRARGRASRAHWRPKALADYLAKLKTRK